jgi:hypothetical protein
MGVRRRSVRVCVVVGGRGGGEISKISLLFPLV